MAKSGDFKVANSYCRLRGIGHILGELAIFLGESAISEYICTLKIRRISNWIPESAIGPLLLRKGNWPLQNCHF
jgi:hypothetical protein